MPSATPKRFRIMSFDGGGIRGIMSAIWLDALEQELGGSIREHCDLIAGTSTGSILACAAALGIPAADIREMYRKRGREVFPSLPSQLWNRALRTLSQGFSAPKYSDHGLRNVLQSVLRDKRLGDLPASPVLLIPTYNTLTREAVVIKSSHADYKSLPLWEIAKASSSAPTYFPAHLAQIRNADAPLVDGGVVANNPTACAIAEGIKLCAQAKNGITLDGFVVGSLGTGQTTRSISIREAHEWGALEWAIPVIDVLMDGAADATDYIVGQLIPAGRYRRFQTKLSEAYDDMDNADATNVNALVSLANYHLHNEGGLEKIKDLAKLLRDGK